jgi:hypothetical protein
MDTRDYISNFTIRHKLKKRNSTFKKTKIIASFSIISFLCYYMYMYVLWEVFIIARAFFFHF